MFQEGDVLQETAFRGHDSPSDTTLPAGERHDFVLSRQVSTAQDEAFNTGPVFGTGLEHLECQDEPGIPFADVTEPLRIPAFRPQLVTSRRLGAACREQSSKEDRCRSKFRGRFSDESCGTLQPTVGFPTSTATERPSFVANELDDTLVGTAIAPSWRQESQTSSAGLIRPELPGRCSLDESSNDVFRKVERQERCTEQTYPNIMEGADICTGNLDKECVDKILPSAAEEAMKMGSLGDIDPAAPLEYRIGQHHTSKSNAYRRQRHHSVVTISSMPAFMASGGNVPACQLAWCRRMRLCWLVHPYSFPEKELEAIFQHYYVPMKLLNILLCALLILLIHVGIQVLIWTSRPGTSGFLETPLERFSFTVDLVVGFLCLALFICCVFLLGRTISLSPEPQSLKTVTIPSILLMVLMTCDCFLVTHHAYSQPRMPSTALWYVSIVVMVINTKLTVNNFLNLVVSVVLATTWMIYTAVTSDSRDAVYSQVFASALLLYVSISFGVSYRLLFERVLRRTFYDTTRHMDVANRLARETGQQRSLLLSIFPDSIAKKMTEEIIRDLEEEFANFGDKELELPFLLSGKRDAQFHRSLMDRCENVSVLCADIVSFTETSSSMLPQELVAMLNDVFARFDNMAQEEGCDRIKILGDGYVCVAGVPQHCVDHADRCVRTGSRFVKEIRYISLPHGKLLQLRVGIHSGAVICGVLGLRKWSFDVWGHDVNIASLLESTGKPGCIHISSVTRDLLTDASDYVIESADPVTYNGCVIDTAFAIHDPLTADDLFADANSNRNILHHGSDIHPFSNFRAVSVPFDSVTIVSDDQLAENEEPAMYNHGDAMRELDTADLEYASSPGRAADVLSNDSTAALTVCDVDPDKPQQATIKSLASKYLSSTSKPTQEAYKALSRDLHVRADFREFSNKLTMLTLRFKDKDIGETYNKSHDRTFEINMIFYALVNMMSVLVLHIAVTPMNFNMLSGYINLFVSSLVVIGLVVKRLNRRFRVIVHSPLRRIRKSYAAQMTISIISFAVLHCTIDISVIPCRIHGMEPRYTYLDRCSSVANSSSAACTLLDLELVTISANYCHPAVPVTSAMPNMSSKTPTWQWQGWQRVVCNATTDIHGSRLPVPQSPQDTGCDFPHLVWHTKMFSLIAMVMIMRLPLAWMVPIAVLFAGSALILTLTVYRMSFTDSYFYWIQISQKPDYPPYFQHTSLFLALVAIVTILVHGRPTEVVTKVSHLWYYKYSQNTKRNKQIHQANIYLLHNILPKHVAKHFLSPRTRSKYLYSCYHEDVAVMFCSIPNFAETFYHESSSNRHGMECMRLLNEIFADWDKLLSKPAYSGVEKIKTIGPTYMLVAGLDQPVTQHCPADMLADYARSMFDVITEINMHAFQNFKLRIGLHVGPVVSGVIGAKKPLFDIWGDTVNVASRMDSTGVNGKVQVMHETASILKHHGYDLERRGKVFVKGKGEVTTHFISSWPIRKITTEAATSPDRRSRQRPITLQISSM